MRTPLYHSTGANQFVTLIGICDFSLRSKRQLRCAFRYTSVAFFTYRPSYKLYKTLQQLRCAFRYTSVAFFTYRPGYIRYYKICYVIPTVTGIATTTIATLIFSYLIFIFRICFYDFLDKRMTNDVAGIEVMDTDICYII